MSSIVHEMYSVKCDALQITSLDLQIVVLDVSVYDNSDELVIFIIIIIIMLYLSNSTRDPEDFSHFDLLNNQ